MSGKPDDLEPDADTDLGPEPATEVAPKSTGATAPGPAMRVEYEGSSARWEQPRVVVVNGTFTRSDGAASLIGALSLPGSPPTVVIATAIDDAAKAWLAEAGRGALVVPEAAVEDVAAMLGVFAFAPEALSATFVAAIPVAHRVEIDAIGLKVVVPADRSDAVHRHIASVAMKMATAADADHRQILADRLARLSGSLPARLKPAPPAPVPDPALVHDRAPVPALAPGPAPASGPDPVATVGARSADKPVRAADCPLPELEQHGIVSPAILLREAARASRQWRTYAGRAAFSGLLMSIVLLAVGAGTQWVNFAGAPDPANFGSMGRNLFIGFAVVQVLVAMVVAPLMAARSIIEEREERTLELIVLTKISPRQIFLAKIGSSLLLGGTLVLGAMPVLSLVTSLGGVSVVEVVAVTLDALSALVVLGVLGAFFALFTRSQVLAAVAALLFALPTFIVVPWLYVMAIASPSGATHLSPLYGTAATGWVAIIPIFAYVPTVVRAIRIGSNVFSMRVANASYGRLFQWEVWRSRAWGIELGVLAFCAFTLLPTAMVGAWAMMIAGQNGTPMISANADLALTIASQGAVWLWTVFAISSASWLYLRLGAEWVIALESMILPAPGSGKKPKKQPPPSIVGNPVLWHEFRLRNFGSLGLGMVVWVLMMWMAFQSLLWAIPGGLLVIGGANAIAGWFVAAWFGVATIEKERREGTLELLLSSTMSNFGIIIGKMLGVAVPSLPLVLVGAPLLALGVPHASLVSIFDPNGIDWGSSELTERFLRGGMIGMWSIAMWAFVAALALCAAVRAPNPRQGYGIVFGVVGGMLLVPWMLSVGFSWFAPVAVFTRMLLPFLAIDAPWWEPAVPTAGLLLGALAMAVLLIVQLRAWSAKVLA